VRLGQVLDVQGQVLGGHLQIPLGHIPAGSGNALAKNVTHAFGERLDPLGAAVAIAKGGQQPIGLMDVAVPESPVVVSFLSLSGAVISDIDIESECLRCFGSARFTIYAVYRVLCPRALDAELYYWPTDAAARPAPGAAPAIEAPLPDGPWQKIEDNMLVFWGTNAAWTSYDVHLAPGKGMSDGTWSLVVLRGVGRLGLLRLLLGLESGGHLESGQAELIRCRAFRLTPRSATGHLSLDGEEVPFAPIQVWPSRHQGCVLGTPQGQGHV